MSRIQNSFLLFEMSIQFSFFLQFSSNQGLNSEKRTRKIVFYASKKSLAYVKDCKIHSSSSFTQSLQWAITNALETFMYVP